jgi:hypothetical protein
MFCAPGLFFSVTEGVGSLFHVLRSHTHFRRYRGRQVLFSCFARPDSCLAVPRASGPVFMFCAPELVFGGTEGVGSSFHVLRSRTHFRRYRGRHAPVFMLCVPGLFFSVTKGVRSRFHVLRSRTHFRRYRGRRVPFSCFARQDSFSALLSASGLVFMFCAPELIFSGTAGVGSHFHVLRSQTRFRRC